MTDTTMRDKIAAIIDKNLPEDYDFGVEAAAAIIAALPGMVVPLVWDKAPTVGYAENVTQMSGQYWIGGSLHGDWVVTGFSHFVGKTFPTLEAAKAAANAHNAAAVCKAMGWV